MRTKLKVIQGYKKDEPFESLLDNEQGFWMVKMKPVYFNNKASAVVYCKLCQDIAERFGVSSLPFYVQEKGKKNEKPYSDKI